MARPRHQVSLHCGEKATLLAENGSCSLAGGLLDSLLDRLEIARLLRGNTGSAVQEHQELASVLSCSVLLRLRISTGVVFIIRFCRFLPVAKVVFLSLFLNCGSLLQCAGTTACDAVRRERADCCKLALFKRASPLCFCPLPAVVSLAGGNEPRTKLQTQNWAGLITASEPACCLSAPIFSDELCVSVALSLF